MWSTWRGPPDPGRLSKLCASRAAYPPDSRDGVDSRAGEHPLSEQVIDENGEVAFRTRSSHSQGSAEQVAGFAAADADEPLAALAALVDRVIDECFAALKCLAHQCQNRPWGFDGGAGNCVAGELAHTTSRVSTACLCRTPGSRPDHHANPHAWAFGLMASRLDPPSAMSGARGRRVQRRSVHRAW